MMNFTSSSLGGLAHTELGVTVDPVTSKKAPQSVQQKERESARSVTKSEMSHALIPEEKALACLAGAPAITRPST